MEEFKSNNPIEQETGIDPVVEELWAEYVALDDDNYEDIVSVSKKLYPKLVEAKDPRAVQIEQYLDTATEVLENSGHDVDDNAELIEDIEEIIGEDGV